MICTNLSSHHKDTVELIMVVWVVGLDVFLPERGHYQLNEGYYNSMYILDEKSLRDFVIVPMPNDG